VARLAHELTLIPTHPDRVAGLGFLSNTVYAFVLLAAAHGALLAADRQPHSTGAALLDFKIEVAVVLAFMLLLVFGPLAVCPRLAAAKERDSAKPHDRGGIRPRVRREVVLRRSRSRGALSGRGHPVPGRPGNSFEVVRTMRAPPITRDALVVRGGDTRAGRAALTTMSLEELVKTLLGTLF
jgi:hypothetical protein